MDGGAETRDRRREPWIGADAGGSGAQARDQHRTDLYVAQSAAELSTHPAIEPPQFASVELAPSPPASERLAAPTRAQGQIEIVLPGGVLVRVDAHVDG